MPDNNNDLLRYAGLGAQIFVSLGIAVFLGHLADEKLKWKVPVVTIVLPLVVLIGLIYNIVKQTSKKK
ncbi:MAG: AtpZ/AtpI family protein [Flavisolibacter sp.]